MPCYSHSPCTHTLPWPETAGLGSAVGPRLGFLNVGETPFQPFDGLPDMLDHLALARLLFVNGTQKHLRSCKEVHYPLPDAAFQLSADS